MKIKRIKETLEQAKGGLEWYNKNHPEMKEQIKWQETIIWALEKQVPKRAKVICRQNKQKFLKNTVTTCKHYERRSKK